MKKLIENSNLMNQVYQVSFLIFLFLLCPVRGNEQVGKQEHDPEKLYSEEKVQWEKMEARFKKKAAFKLYKDKKDLPRVLLIGDSISIGYTPIVREKLVNKANVHRAMANSGTTKAGLAGIKDWLGSGSWDIIHFNWGLHDVSLRKNYGTTKAEYKKNLEELVKRLKGTGAKLIWASTTPIPEGSQLRRKGDEVGYNAIAFEVMQRNGIEINDLHAYVFPKLEKYQMQKNVHFKSKGYRFLGEEVARKIETALTKKKKK